MKKPAKQTKFDIAMEIEKHSLVTWDAASIATVWYTHYTKEELLEMLEEQIKRYNEKHNNK